MKKLIPQFFLALIFSAAILFSCKNDDDLTTYDKNNELIGVWEFLDSRQIWINVNAKDTLFSYKDTTIYRDSTGTVIPKPSYYFFSNDLIEPNDLTLKKNRNYIIKAYRLSSTMSSTGTYMVEKNKLKFTRKTGDSFESYYKIKSANHLELFSYEGNYNLIQDEKYYSCRVTTYDRKQ